MIAHVPPWLTAALLVPAQGPLSDPLPDIPFGALTVQLEDAVSGRLFPLDVAAAPDGSGRLFFNQNDGRTFVFDGSGVRATPFVELPRLYSFNGSAMAALAFHPEFAAEELSGAGGRVYVVMTEDPGTGPADFGIPSGEVHQSVLYELRVSAGDPNVADPASLRRILRINEATTIHNIDDLAFGSDGYLYLAKGDDQTGGQDPSTVHGTVLRIDVDRCPGNPLAANGRYSIPADNPFLNDATGLDEVYAYGFRNPWRLTVDRASGELFVFDIGDRDIEEVNRVELADDGSARNYGWPEKEGRFRYLGVNQGVSDDLSGLPPGVEFTDPVGEYDHGELDNSITGGVVYRGRALPSLAGHVVFADWISGGLFELDPATGVILRIAYDPAGATVHGQPPAAGGQPPEGVIAVREDAAGELLLVVAQRNLSSSGRIVRVGAPGCALESRCTVAANSSGSPARLTASGSASVAANDLGLVAFPLPAGVPGLFFHGTAAVEVPFGDGFRCAGGQVTRIFPVVHSDAAGTLATTLDNRNPRHARIQPGTTLHFQAWFRDAAAGGAGFQLSDALAVRFCR